MSGPKRHIISQINGLLQASKIPLETGFCVLSSVGLSVSIRALCERSQRLNGSLSGISMKTFSAKPDSVKRDWYVIDASDKVLGRLSTEIARRLRGKHKPEFTPHVDTGDYIIVINAEKVRVTGNKETDKMYHHHTGFIGNLKSTNLAKLRIDHPERIIQQSVKGMLPKNSLGRAMFKKLKVYAGAAHQHSAQQPQPLEI
jgi:large subunit ribosomal protein L13